MTKLTMKKWAAIACAAAVVIVCALVVANAFGPKLPTHIVTVRASIEGGTGTAKWTIPGHSGRNDAIGSGAWSQDFEVSAQTGTKLHFEVTASKTAKTVTCEILVDGDTFVQVEGSSDAVVPCDTEMP